MVLYYIRTLLEWIHNEIPVFDADMSKTRRNYLVVVSAQCAFFVSILLLCICLPILNYLKVKSWFFKFKHNIGHYLPQNCSSIFKYRWYYNKSFKIYGLWVIIACSCTLIASNHDLLLITKRLGRISVALIPSLLFLTLRPSPLPHTLYLSLLPIHKCISRIIVLQSTLHATFYIWYFHKSNKMSKLLKLENIFGVISLVIFIFIGITSLPKYRRLYFSIFYYIHYIGVWMSVVLVYFHARPSVSIYTGLNVCILLSQIIYRILNTKQTQISVIPVSSSLVLVEFPSKDLSKKPILPSSHIRINNIHLSFIKRWFHHLIPLQHPFTIASLPNESTVKLIVRRGNFPLIQNHNYYVTGAFEPKIDFISKAKSFSNNELDFIFPNYRNGLSNSPLNFNVNARKVLIVVGGSAISFALPMLRILNFNGINVRLIWVSRDYCDLKLLDHFKNNFNGMEIYITGSVGSEQDLQIDYVDYEEQTTNRRYVYGSLSSITKEGISNNDNVLPPSTATILPNNSSYSTFLTNYSSTGARLEDQAAVDGNDEVDFTQLFSSKRSKSYSSYSKLFNLPTRKNNIFRQPAIVIPPNGEYSEDTNAQGSQNDMILKIPTGVKLFFGRPNLSDLDYQWCLQKDCIGPSSTNECCNSDMGGTHVDDLCNVWVIAAGPSGLVKTTRRWAIRGGLHFHEENFCI